MKTTISLPDQLFEMAERVASEQKISRSELYREALEEFIRVRHSWVIREKLDEGYREDLVHQAEPPAFDQELLRKAGRLTGLSDEQALVRLALEALIARESARRLAELGGSEPDLEPVPRRRPTDS